MTKLIIQIPCLNEADGLPHTLSQLPRHIPGIDRIEILVIDDGSTDNTARIARMWGVHHIVRHRSNRGLAAAYRTGIEAALRAGADIIVNTDADAQYAGEDVATIVRPIVEHRADIVIGDRGVGNNAHFGHFKRQLQKLGSAIVRLLSKVEAPDAVSGFRAISRDAAIQINITTEFSYTTDMLIQAGRKRLAIISVPIRTNRTTRPSRLFKSVPGFVLNQGLTMVRAYATYNPLRVFMGIGAFLLGIGIVPMVRFLVHFAAGDGSGHLQSLIIGGALMVLGSTVMALGIIADLIAANRKLIEANLARLHRIEQQLDTLGETSGRLAVNEITAWHRAS